VCGPNTRVLIASNKGENADDFLTGIKGHLESNEHLQWLFPDILVKDPQRNAREWTQSAITVTRSRRDLRESTIQAIGVTGELTSKHYDHGVFDDIVGKENAATKAEREKVWDFLMKARPLFDPGSTKDYVGTHWHYADAWARLKAQRRLGQRRLGVYEVPCWAPTGARAQDDPEVRAGIAGLVPGHGWVRVVFPERFCLDKPDPDDATDQRLELLAERRGEPSNFNAQYLLDPSSAETAHFPRLDPEGQGYLQIVDTAPPLADLWVAMSVDPAQSLHKWADFSAIAIGGFDRRGDLYLLELWQGKRDDEGLVRRMYDLHARFTERGAAFKAIGVEAIGFAKAYRHVITIEGDRRGFYLPVIAYERDTKVTKQVRIGGIQGQWMSRQIHALASCEALADFVDQADKFRMEADNDHDDLLDAVADLYQLRGRPSAKADPFAGDELAQRAQWEQALPRELDAMSRRVAWHHHQARLSREADEEQRALSTAGATGGMELWG
jgi:predicted phage terminase large subunit-like protein